MSRTLAAGVVLRHPGSGNTVFLRKGSELPGWADGLVGEHALEPNVSVVADLPVFAERLVEELGRAGVDPPPRAGAGSSRAKWAEYAVAIGVAAEPDATRDEIIAVCEAAGVPTD